MSSVFPITDDPRYRRYTASAGQKVFPIPFPFLQDEDVEIRLQTAPTEYTIFDPADYSLIGANDPAGGTVTLNVGRSAGDIILVLGTAILDRMSSIVRDGRFSSGLIDSELDRIRIIEQEFRRDNGRAVKSDYGKDGLTLDPDIENGATLMRQGNRLTAGPNLPELASSMIAEATAEADRAEQEANRSDLQANRSRSEADRAAGYVNDIVSEKEVPITGTRNGMQDVSFRAGLNSLETRGYAAMGDGGGAQYVRVASEPSHSFKVRSLDRFLPNGTVDPVNGGWWEIANYSADVLFAGASPALPTPSIIAGSVALKPDAEVGAVALDTSPALQRAIDYASSFGKFAEAPEGVYGIDGYKGSRPVWTTGDFAHGGLIIRPGTRLVGAGMGKTIFRNTADNWRCVFSLVPGRISIQGITIDGDIANHPNIPLGTTGPAAGPVRGEGVITAFSGDIELLIEDVEVVNTAHYGIGLQVGKIRSGLLRNLHFRNIGGDCIDIKTHTTPDTSKQLILEQLFAHDGCGHNYIGGPGVSPHENQACFDIGGPSIVRGVRIYGLDSYGTQIGNVGIRTRAAINAEYRTQARFADVSDFYIKSSKLAGEGSGALKRIIGVVVNSENTHISNGTIEDCFDGLRSFSATADNTANNGVIRDITALNCRGAEAGAGFRLTSGARGTKGGGLIAENCDIGLSVTTTKVALHGVHLKNNGLGLDASDEALRDSNISGVTFEGNTVDKNSATVPVSREYMPSPVTVVAERSAFINLVSTYNGSGWTGLSFGGVRIHKADTTGVPVGEVARFDFRSSGDSGGNGFWVASVKTVDGNWRDLLTVSTDVAALDVGLQLKSRTVAELAAETVTAGKMFYCPNGNAGSPCLAVGVGGSWLRAALGPAVSTS